MQQARYSEHNHGHYGLAADYYTHFTSPIRRYPDLLVHRMIRDYGRSKEIAEHFEQVIPEIATQSSNRERRAIEAEREVEAMKKAEYMEEYVGEEYDAVVSSIVKFGLFVELPTQLKAWFTSLIYLNFIISMSGIWLFVGRNQEQPSV